VRALHDEPTRIPPSFSFKHCALSLLCSFVSSLFAANHALIPSYGVHAALLQSVLMEGYGDEDGTYSVHLSC